MIGVWRRYQCSNHPIYLSTDNVCECVVERSANKYPLHDEQKSEAHSLLSASQCSSWSSPLLMNTKSSFVQLDVVLYMFYLVREKLCGCHNYFGRFCSTCKCFPRFAADLLAMPIFRLKSVLSLYSTHTLCIPCLSASISGWRWFLEQFPNRKVPDSSQDYS